MAILLVGTQAPRGFEGKSQRAIGGWIGGVRLGRAQRDAILR